MEIEAGTMEINGMPYEWVKCKEPVRIKDLNQENLFAELLQSQDSKRAGETCRFLLSLLEQVRQDKDFILKNFHTLAWRLPYYFVGSTVEESREQWDLLDQISKVHDFFGVFQVYVQQCRNVITRSESSNTELLQFITANEDIIVEKIQKIVNGAGEDFWDQYLRSEAKTVLCQSGEKRKEKFPCVPEAVARVVCNDSQIYPILPGIYTLYVMKKMGHTEKVSTMLHQRINAELYGWLDTVGDLLRCMFDDVIQVLVLPIELFKAMDSVIRFRLKHEAILVIGYPAVWNVNGLSKDFHGFHSIPPTLEVLHIICNSM